MLDRSHAHGRALPRSVTPVSCRSLAGHGLISDTAPRSCPLLHCFFSFGCHTALFSQLPFAGQPARLPTAASCSLAAHAQPA